MLCHYIPEVEGVEQVHDELLDQVSSEQLRKLEERLGDYNAQAEAEFDAAQAAEDEVMKAAAAAAEAAIEDARRGGAPSGGSA